MSNPWTREELIVTLALYFQLPFGRLNHTTKEVIDLAHLIGRSENSVAIRLSNFASCDPYIINSGRHGMVGGISICRPIWDEYAFNKEKLFLEAESYLASFKQETIEKHLGLQDKDFEGKERTAVIKQRVNQSAFRAMILNNYDSCCAITGLNIPGLLIASHIIPWRDKVYTRERLNPENGICLSPLYDKAFDTGLIGITTDYEVILSKELVEHSGEDFFKEFFSPINHKKITLPEEHKPNPVFLQYHLNKIFAPHN